MVQNDLRPQRTVLIYYFGLCFLMAWVVWIPAGLWAAASPALVLLGAWAPTLAALLVTGATEGRTGLWALMRSLTKWRVPAKYYAFAILSVLGLALLSMSVHVLLGGPRPEITDTAARFGVPANLFLVLTPLIFVTSIFFGGPIAEELGWRGFAQPRLQSQLGAGTAGLLIGFLWSLWHLPLFYFSPGAVGNLPVGYYIPLVTALGVLFAWLYNRSEGSVLLCILLHAGVNFAVGIIGGNGFTADRTLMTILVLLMSVLALLLYKQIRSIHAMP